METPMSNMKNALAMCNLKTDRKMFSEAEGSNTDYPRERKRSKGYG